MFNFYTQRAWLYKIYYFLFSWKRTLFTACPASLILCFNFVLFFNSDCSCDLKWSSSVLSLSNRLIVRRNWFDQLCVCCLFSVSVFQNVGICCCCCCLTNSRDEGKNRSGICLNLLLLRVWLVEKNKNKRRNVRSCLPGELLTKYSSGDVGWILQDFFLVLFVALFEVFMWLEINRGLHSFCDWCN